MNLTIQEEKRWGSKLCTNFILPEMLVLLIVPICFSEKVVQPALHHLLWILLDWAICSFIMGTKIIHKGIKYISQIFVVKEQEMEMEIGNPTDVKHVAHIGWDGPSTSAPSWMNEFKTVPNFAATSIGSLNERGSNSAVSTWSSQEFESMDSGPPTETLKDVEIPSDLPRAPRKQKRRKKKTPSSSSPKSAAAPKASRAVKSKAKYVEENARSSNVELM